MKIDIPTINDNSEDDFLILSEIWSMAIESKGSVSFDFADCIFLRQNAVAFLGGLARLLEYQGRGVQFRWDTLTSAVLANLQQNGFASAFGCIGKPWVGNSIPYMENWVLDTDSITDYLSSRWLEPGWVNVSKPLSDAIVSTVWEIYMNAFEHSSSPIGVVSCGQFYPNLRLLKLAVVDFGIGIPQSVRRYHAKQSIHAGKCLEWAFREGTSTKNDSGIGRGLGLGLLKRFIQVNSGRLQICSNDGYAIIGKDEERFVGGINGFNGTLVNITFECDDTYYYLDTYEMDGLPF